jgi:hypothetical protein
VPSHKVELDFDLYPAPVRGEGSSEANVREHALSRPEARIQLRWREGVSHLSAVPTRNGGPPAVDISRKKPYDGGKSTRVECSGLTLCSRTYSARRTGSEEHSSVSQRGLVNLGALPPR